MIQQKSKAIRLVCLASVTMLLDGCFGDPRPAPVINAWYQPSAASKFYVVRSGDTIYSIAFAFGLDYRALVVANHLSLPYHITAGQRLIMTHKPATETQNLIPVHTMPLVVHSESTKQPDVSPKKPVSEPHFSTKFTWNWPVTGRLIGQFSRSPKGHPGISIAGRLGEPVRATATGTVVYSGDGVRGYGNLIIIKHNESYLSAYAFNQHNAVTVGEHVQAGNVIARMGKNDAGRTLLYFEIRRNGVPMNPLWFLK